MSLEKRNDSPFTGSKRMPATRSGKNVICVGAAPGALTRWAWFVLPKRVEISISRRVGCQLEKAADRNSVYRQTSSASEAGTGGTPSTTRLSAGLMTFVSDGAPVWPRAADEATRAAANMNRRDDTDPSLRKIRSCPRPATPRRAKGSRSPGLASVESVMRLRRSGRLRGSRVRGERLSRHHSIAHGRVVRERRHDRRSLHQVVLLQPLVEIHVGVMGPRFVLQLVLDELEGRQPHFVERLVIGAAGLVHRDERGAEIGERLEPGLEDGDDTGVVLAVDPADLSAPVVEVEIDRQLRVLRLGRDGPGLLAPIEGLIL